MCLPIKKEKTERIIFLGIAKLALLKLFKFTYNFSV